MSKSPIPFRGFDETGEVRIYDKGVLPHWRQKGCTYFVTFRLADSIPRKVVESIEYERALWLNARNIDPHDIGWKRLLIKLPPVERRGYEKLMAKLINKSLDECHGSCVLRNPLIANIVADALDYFHESRVLTGDFVIMPNHVHVLMTPLDGYELEDILHSIKSYTANEINRRLNRSGRCWQRESFDHIVRDGEQLAAYQKYTEANPKKARLADGEYLLSKAEYVLEPP